MNAKVKLKHLRQVDRFVVHCSATKPSQPAGAAEIDRWHRARDWLKIGYHFVIRRDGTREKGRELTEQGAHAGPQHNWNTVGICLEGGLNETTGKAENNFTQAQFAELEALIKELDLKFGEKDVCGHRDLSPDKDGDGVIEPHEWLKQCPCFDVRSWAASVGLR